MRTLLWAGLILLLAAACSSPPSILKLHSMPLVFVERRINPIGFRLVMAFSQIEDGAATISISDGYGTYFLDPVSARTGDVMLFEIDDQAYRLKVVAMGISRHQAAGEYGLNIENFPIGRDCGVFEITPRIPVRN